MRLFDQFRNPLLRYALSLGISVHDAEEVTQEVFLALFRRLQLGRPRKNLRGWIFRVAHNLVSGNGTRTKTRATESNLARPSPNSSLILRPVRKSIYRLLNGSAVCWLLFRLSRRPTKIAFASAQRA